MHLAVLIVNGHVFLDAGSDGLVVYHDGTRLSGKGINNDLKNIEKLPRIPSAITEKCFIFNNLDIPFLQQHVLRQGTLKEYPEVFHFKGFEHENLAA